MRALVAVSVEVAPAAKQEALLLAQVELPEPVIGHLVWVFVQAPRARGDDDTRAEEGLVSRILIRSKINNCYVPRVVTPLSTETHVITAAS